MTQLPVTRVNDVRSGLHDILALAALNPMENALVRDMLDLLAKVERYPLVYKIDWR
jgi:hypothetical protein